MNRKSKIGFISAISLLAAFALWTLLVRYVDVRMIGPQESWVGLATINAEFHNLTGVHIVLYNITDWLGLVPVAVCLCFAAVGLFQWISRKSIAKVDASILILGGFYILTITAYLFFEYVVVNYRPVLINNYLEASYPSSTTLLVLCVMTTSIMQLHTRIHSTVFRRCVEIVQCAFICFMVIGRLVSGVHWFTDIIGGILLSGGLVAIYYGCVKLTER